MSTSGSKAIKNGHLNTEMPPTPEDVKLSVRHHKDSVAYNLRHSKDHFEATTDHIERMSKVAGKKQAAVQAKKAQAAINKMEGELKPYLKAGKPKKKEKKS